MIYCRNFCPFTDCEYHFANANTDDFIYIDRKSSCSRYNRYLAGDMNRRARGEYNMVFKTGDFAHWTIEEYRREDGSKPTLRPDANEKVRIFGVMADLFAEKIGDGTITTDIDKETESLIIEFSSEGVGKGRFEIEGIFEK